MKKNSQKNKAVDGGKIKGVPSAVGKAKGKKSDFARMLVEADRNYSPVKLKIADILGDGTKTYQNQPPPVVNPQPADDDVPVAVEPKVEENVPVDVKPKMEEDGVGDVKPKTNTEEDGPAEPKTKDGPGDVKAKTEDGPAEPKTEEGHAEPPQPKADDAGGADTITVGPFGVVYL